MHLHKQRDTWPKVVKVSGYHYKVNMVAGGCVLNMCLFGWVRSPYLGCEVLFHNHTIAKAHKQLFHPCDVKFSPLPGLKMIKLSIAYDESQASAACFVLYWIDLQEMDIE